MKTISLIITTMILTFSTAMALADSYTQGDITISDAWSRPTPPGVSVGVGYMAISNGGKAALTLVGASTPKAEEVTIHQSQMKDGLMSMRPLPDGLVIPPGETVLLEPHGYHLMLEGLTGAVVRDEKIPLTLDFGTAENMQIELRAMPMGPGKQSHSGHSR